MNRDVLRDLFHLVWQWWTGDRIRVSPVEGQLLRVRPGDILSIDATDVEVVNRFLIEDQQLCLICAMASATFELHIPIHADLASQGVMWIESNSQRRLMPADIEVWPRGRGNEAI